MGAGDVKVEIVKFSFEPVIYEETVELLCRDVQWTVKCVNLELRKENQAGNRDLKVRSL